MCLGLICLVGCSADGDGGANGQELLPSQTVTDWVTFGDVAARVRVLEVREVPATEEEVQAGEGVIGRQVRLGVTDVVWQRPDRALPVPSEVVIDAGGWTFRGDVRQPLESRGGVRLEPGRDYFVVLAKTRLARGGDPVWLPIGAGAMLPFDGAVIGPAGDAAILGEGAEDVVGMSDAQLATRLDKVAPAPDAGSAMGLDALARLEAVQASK